MVGLARTLQSAAAAIALAAFLVPAAGFAQSTQKTLRFIPQADLRSIDPIWTTAYVTRNFGYWSSTRCSRSTRISSRNRRWSTAGR